jgi:hypothetical protein
MAPRKKPESPKIDRPVTPTQEERREEVNRQADRGGHGINGGIEREPGHELER